MREDEEWQLCSLKSDEEVEGRILCFVRGFFLVFASCSLKIGQEVEKRQCAAETQPEVWGCGASSERYLAVT